MDKRDPNLVLAGKKIREARKAKGFSQESFAHYAGFDRTYIGCIERGEQNVSLKNICRIAIALDMEMADFLPRLKEIVF